MTTIKKKWLTFNEKKQSEISVAYAMHDRCIPAQKVKKKSKIKVVM